MIMKKIYPVLMIVLSFVLFNCGNNSSESNQNFSNSSEDIVENESETAVNNISENSGTFTDARDGHTYKWVKIGNQIWMAENLNYETSDGSWCYDNNSNNCNDYGRLYDWETAKKVAPEGWHLPSRDEFNTLINFIGGETNESALKLKSKSGGWLENGNGYDSYGFNAKSVGYYHLQERFCCIGISTHFWSSDGYYSNEDDEYNGYCLSIYYDSSKLGAYLTENAKNGFPVRLIKDY
jgi:uncharacterized protein (TIGR02145 family)